MPLSSGTCLGPYQIIEPLGAGGMGEVYRARDTRLDRIVAVKVLAADLAGRPDVYQRFEREGRAVSALNHPNICSLFDIGNHQGMPYLVMECLEGETLAERLARGPVPLAEAWPMLLQMGAALQEAHARGIVHRDLKPGNIMLIGQDRATVKLLDFGLAKIPLEKTSTGSPTSVPTVMNTLTSAGAIVGTFQYMAPEQIEGKEADARTDIFAFGAVIFEMLTGRKAFAAKTQASLIGAIMASEPPRVSSVAPMSPPALDRLVQKCLAKDPQDRWQTVREVVNEIRWISESGSQTALAPAVMGRPGRRRAWMATAISSWVLLLATLAAWAWTGWFREKPEAMGAVRFPLEMPEEASFILNSRAAPQSVPSPDGRKIAFIALVKSTPFLFVRSLDSPAAQRLEKTEGALHPFWSPDGQFVGFFADQHLKRIAASGASLQTICAVAGSGDGATWNRDGVILFAPLNSGLMRVPAAGGIPAPVTTLDKSHGEDNHSWPQFLPDGRHFLYFAHSQDPEKTGIYVQELGSQERKFVLRNSLRAAYASGHLLFVREGTLLAQKFDPANGRLEGEPVAVAEDVTSNEGNGRAAFALSANGVLAYRGGGVIGLRQLTWYDRDGKRLGAVGEPAPYVQLALSPDEKRVALSRAEAKSSTANIWVLELGNGVLTRLTFDPRESNGFPTWSRDSQRIAFSNGPKGGISEVVVASAARSVLVDDKAAGVPEDWSPDGRYFAWSDNPQTKLSLLSLSGERKSQVVFDNPFAKHMFRFSPDGRWVAYISTQSGIAEVYVASLPSFAEVRQISSGGGNFPSWRGGGNELFFIGQDQRLWVAEIKGASKMEPVAPKPLFLIHLIGRGTQYAVTADGKKFLVNERLTLEQQTTVVVHWDADLNR